MAERQWTPEQRDAIEARGGTILVSAAAGSGKTAVLVERVMGRILDPQSPVDADHLLVVTFSNAAALEMKQRLMEALDTALARDPSNRILQKQRRLAEQAKICTIHAFCLDLIRENAHRLGLTPNVRAGDEKELDLLRRECMEQAVEEFYEEASNEHFLELVELLGTGRDDHRLLDTLRDFYNFARSHPFFHQWLDEKMKLYDVTLPVSQTVWGKVILREAEETLRYCVGLLSKAIKIIQQNPDMSAAYLPAFQSDVRKLERLREFCMQGNWDGMCQALKELKRDRLGSLSGTSPEKQKVTGIRDVVYQKIIVKLQKGTAAKEGYFCANEQEFTEDIAFLRPIVFQLFQLVKRFDAIFLDRKKQKTIIDFSDMEQFAAALLAVPTFNGWQRSVLAQSLGEAYEEILIDEFQDTNEVQEMIFNSISRDGSNLFLVGDVKQSIYRFRQACPRLFLAKKETFAPYGQGHFPAKILLRKNFRSAPEVTTGINFFFSILMSKSFADISYDEEEALFPGKPYPSGPDRGCVLRVLDLKGQPLDKNKLEAKHAARQIRELLDSGHMVTGKREELRPVRPSDICILMRSGKRAKLYRDALEKNGVPAWCESHNAFLKSREIAPLVCLLQVLSNPLSDIDLVSVMLSPLFDFQPDELAQIRMESPKDTVYMAVRQYASKGDAHCIQLLRLLEQFRLEAARMTADCFLRKVFDLTGYEHKVLVMPGTGRHENLLLFVEYARAYRSSCTGVYAFGAFLKRLLSNGEDLSPASGCSEQANVVRIMTIHRSKGLEFPIVFLCDCAREFNKADYVGGILWNSEMGFACARRDFSIRKQYVTVPLQALKLEQQRESLAEELRMLYVAMTRAKELLILTGVSKDFYKSLPGWDCPPESSGKLPPYRMRSAKSYLEWLMMAVSGHINSGMQPSDAIQETVPLTHGLRFEYVSVAAQEEHTEQQAPLIPDYEAEKRQLEDRLSFRYEHPEWSQIPGKIAASQLGKGSVGKAFRFHPRPAFLTGEKLTGAQRGNALHKFMQFADYHQAALDPESEVLRLTEKGFLSRQEAEAVNIEKLRRFFSSNLAARIFASDKVLREMRFLAEAGRDVIGDYMDLPDDDCKVVVQGIADCVFFEPDGAVIVDYKSDGVRTPEALVDRYQGQLEIYRRLLDESLGAPVKECILYSFALSREITAFHKTGQTS